MAPKSPGGPIALPVKSNPRPNFDTDVLSPLRKDQAQEAAVAAAEAPQAASTLQQAPTSPQVAQTAPVSVTGGTCAQWLAAAGVTDITDAMLVINRESGCNPYAVEPTSGACGVAQENPCGKSGCTFGDGACEVSWMNSYVLGRYGSWAAAYAHELAYNWY